MDEKTPLLVLEEGRSNGYLKVKADEFIQDHHKKRYKQKYNALSLNQRFIVLPGVMTRKLQGILIVL